MVSAVSGTPSVDGRRARRDRGKTAVVDAMFELLQEGQLPPAVEAIAERAGVSVSSVFRYFENLDDLQQRTIERYFERFASLFTIPAMGQGPLDDRIKRLVDSRLDLYEVIGPIAVMARARAVDSPRLARTLDQTRSMQAGLVRAHFAPELASLTPARGDDLVLLIDSMTSFEAWDLLRTTHRRSRQQIRRAWLVGLKALCAVTNGRRP